MQINPTFIFHLYDYKNRCNSLLEIYGDFLIEYIYVKGIDGPIFLHYN